MDISFDSQPGLTVFHKGEGIVLGGRHEAAGYMASIVGRQRADFWCSALFLLFIQTRSQVREWCYPHLGGVFAPHLT